MKRFVLLALLLFGANAHADGMLPGGGTLKYNKLYLHEDNSEAPAEPQKDPDSIWGYFNLAHCVCSFFNNNPDTSDPAFFEDRYGYEMTIEGTVTDTTKPVEFWTGTDCANTDSRIRDENCQQADSISLGSLVNNGGVGTTDISIYDLMVPKRSERPGCQMRVQSATTWAMVDTDGDSTFDYFAQDVIETDTEPPPLPTEFKAVGAENAINISWTAPAEGTAGIAYYQALCASTLSGAAAKSSPPAPRYQTARGLCGAAEDALLTPSDIESNTGTDAGVGSIELPQELAQLDKAFICGEATSSTATSMRIDGLKNGTEYTVVFLAIDLYGNATGTYFTSALVPTPATDFWEDLHDQGSGVEGGFCLISQTYGDGNPLTQALRNFRDGTLTRTFVGRWMIDAYYSTVGSLDLHGSIVLRFLVGLALLPFVAFALLWHVLTLPGLLLLVGLGFAARRWNLRRASLRFASVATLFALVVLAPGRAHAQSPYWENDSVTEDDNAAGVGDPARVKWHAGVRLGPYVPGIDAQLDMPAAGKDGPYEAMFGGYSILPMLDVERFFFTNFGQLGAGISIGYMGKKAHPWQAGSDPNDPKRPRASGDDNTFRLFPFSINATYRLSVLDDEYGIPIVPYARAGLAYYVWWLTAPSGDIAKTCTGGGNDPMCPTTSARGASLGLVGSIGIAIRAERVDESAARSMRESGIEHAGFYGEYSLGWVDGFGSSSKLSVGDATWFAGVDFEF